MDRFLEAGCLAVALAAVVPARAGALSTTGAVTLVPAPPSVELDEFESNTEIRLFEESTLVLADDLLVDITVPGTYTDPENVSAGSISAGTAVTSHLLQFDTIASQLVTGIGGSVTFDTPILGVMVFDETLDLSDAADPFQRRRHWHVDAERNRGGVHPIIAAALAAARSRLVYPSGAGARRLLAGGQRSRR